jgi:phage tail-like protein
MARAVATDFLQSCRFHVDAIGVGGVQRLVVPGRPQAGFMQVTTPEASTDAVEYKEGNSNYTKKQSGIPTISDITMSRGVTRGDTSFWDWMRVVLEGGVGVSGEYRADLEIKHFHRDTALVRTQPATGDQPNMTNIDVNTPARIIHARECFPIRCKPSADFDATASEISLGEIDVACEFFEVEDVRAA